MTTKYSVSLKELSKKPEQLAGDLLRGAFDAGLHPLPGLAPQLVQRRPEPLDPHVFLDQAHAVDRQVERVAAVIPQDEKVVPSPLDRQLLKPIVLADAVLIVHDQVALFELLQVQELGAGLCRGLGPAQVPDAELDSPAHRDLALKLARESLVLLKNDARMLPLRKARRPGPPSASA